MSQVNVSHDAVEVGHTQDSKRVSALQDVVEVGHTFDTARLTVLQTAVEVGYLAGGRVLGPAVQCCG